MNAARLDRLRLLVLRGLGSDRRWALGLFAVVAVSTAAAGAFPPAYADAQDDALRREAAAASTRERDLEVVQADRLPVSELDDGLRERLATVPPELARLVADPALAIDTPMFEASAVSGSPDPSGTTRFVTVRSHDELGGRVSFVSGAAPAADAEPLELAVSRATAAALSVRVGDVLSLAPDPQQPALQYVPAVEQYGLTVRIAGVFTVRDPGHPSWFGDRRAARPQVQETETRRLVFAYALAPREAYETLLEETGGMPLTYLWRYRLAAERLTAERLGRVEAAARALELRYPSVVETGAAEPAARTGIGRIADRFREQQRVAGAGLSFAGAGLLALALVVVAAAALAGGGAQRRTLVLARDRGAAGAVDAAAVAAAVVVPAGVVGSLVAALATGRVDGRGLLLASALTLAAAAATAAAVAPRRPPPQDAVAARQVRERRDRRRAALESTLVVLAVACVVALRSREVPSGGFDVLAALTPILVVLAVGAIALRLLPHAARFAGSRLRRRTDLAPALAVRRIERLGALGAPAFVVPLVAAALATFAALSIAGANAGDGAVPPLLQTLRDALRLAAWLAAGYAAAAIVLVVLVLARTNAEEDERLVSLGLRRRPRLALGLVQFVPTVSAGTLLGAAAGVAAFAAVRAAFGAAGEFALGAPEALAAVVALPLAATLAALAAARRPSR